MDGESQKHSLKDQMEQLASGAERASARAREARERYQEFVDRTLKGFGLEKDSPNWQSMEINFETAFTFGHAAGESAETNLSLQDQLVLIRKMIEQFEAREKRDIEREKRDTERADQNLALSERQTVALEALAKARPLGTATKKRAAR